MKKLKIALIVVVVLLVAAAAGIFGYFQYSTGKDGFLRNTTLDGENVAGKTVDELVETIASNYSISGKTVTLLENETTAMTATLEDLGYAFDETTVRTALTAAEQEEKSSFLVWAKTQLSGYDIQLDDLYSFDESVFNSVIVSANFAEARVETVEAGVSFDEASDAYVVTEPVSGNMIDDAALQEYVKEQITQVIDAGEIPANLDITVPESVYTSVAPAEYNAEELQAQADAQNLEYQKEKLRNELAQASITYTFGEETIALTSDTFLNWITIDDEMNVTFDDEQVSAYVSSLASTYNTRHHERTFTSTSGETVTIPASDNEYGYTIDTDEEAAAIKENILSKTAVTREPMYVTTNSYGNPYYLARNGVDDLNGTYVELDLTKQHLWFYKNGELIVESDFVSGDVSDGKETKTGCFPLAWKQSPRTLTGDLASGSGSYSANVQYWMPFYDGQGLHDASWRSSFGGEIYKTNGSHGCVNLPTSVAKTIYENIDTGTAIVIYKS